MGRKVSGVDFVPGKSFFMNSSLLMFQSNNNIFILFTVITKMKHGHCNVASGTPLGNWVSQQRTLSKDNTYRRERLNRLGFCWHPRGSSWDQNFGESKEFEVSSYVTVVGLK